MFFLTDLTLFSHRIYIRELSVFEECAKLGLAFSPKISRNSVTTLVSVSTFDNYCTIKSFNITL